MSYNTKIYSKQGGDELVIGSGAKLTVEPGATVTGIDAGGPSAVAWGDVTGKPATFPPVIGATATTAMAGNTALLAIGTTAATAAAGNHNHAVAADAASGLVAAANLQAAFVALSARIKALEDATA